MSIKNATKFVAPQMGKLAVPTDAGADFAPALNACMTDMKTNAGVEKLAARRTQDLSGRPTMGAKGCSGRSCTLHA